MRWIGAGVIIAVMLFGIERLVVVPWHCNSEIKKLRNETIAALQTDPTTQLSLARTTLAETEALMHDCEPVAENYMIKAANERVLGMDERAAETYRDALGVDRRPEIYANLADVELGLGRRDEARRDYIIAARFTPATLATISDQEMQREVLHELALTGDDRAFRRWHRHPRP